MNSLFLASALLAHLLPPPVIRPVDLRTGEQPIAIKDASSVVEENAYFSRVKTSFVFTNPNRRVMAGEFEFPIPEGAVVCGYALEINGELVPGVVCEKEKARVAFENEVRKGVDPGLVEHVKGNIWKTRIFPLEPNRPRRAEVTYIAPRNSDVDEIVEVYERDGDDVFVAKRIETTQAKEKSVADFGEGVVLWDTSLSRLGKVQSDRAKLETLPEKGNWKLITFSNVPDAPRGFTSRNELIAAVDALVYDGGTDIDAAILAAGESPTLLFTDEIGTLGKAELIESSNIFVASRKTVPLRPIEVRKLVPGEKQPKIAPKPSTLLATVWAARRMEDLAAQADRRQEEFLALGRKYSVAGPGMSLIVLDTLEQYLTHKIEPSEHLPFHDEWVRRRAAEDDQIAAKREAAEFERQLLSYWEERVKWWNDPKPKIVTPKSGLFEEANSSDSGSPVTMSAVAGSVRSNSLRAPLALNTSGNRYLSTQEAAVEDFDDEADECACELSIEAPAPITEPARPHASASVTLKPWNPKTPYVDALKASAKEEVYTTYLKEREAYKDSPAFYLDCADFFFVRGESEIARRIISNLAEFKLENPALWRTMGYRLRQAGEYKEAIVVFRKVAELRSEEGQSYRDLALVLIEFGKQTRNTEALSEGAKLLHCVAFTNHMRRSMRRGNDFQVAVHAIEELNGLITWCKANGVEIEVPQLDDAFRRELPVALRIVLSWDADETDIDLHVLEPNGEEAFYGHRRTREGGFVSEDVTTGYGPEEYLAKDLQKGVYKVLTNYFASHQTALTGATSVQATVYTDWGRAEEKMRILTLRLDKPKDKVTIGEISF